MNRPAQAPAPTPADDDASLNYFRLWISDYVKDTASLSVCEHGAYLLLLLEYYSTGPLPDDLGALHRICRAMNGDEQKAVASVASKFFQVNGDGRRHNKRADLELGKARKAIGAQRQAGRDTAAQRWGTNKVSSSSTDRSSDTTPYPLNPLSPQPLNRQPLNRQPTEKRAAHSAAPRGEGEAKTAEVWKWYSLAYKQRHGIEPLRNRRANGMLAKFLERVPAVEAPEIAAFYVRHSKAAYVGRKHPIGLLLADAETLRTEWATGRLSTDTEARQADRTQALGGAFAPLIAEAEVRDKVADNGGR